MLCDGDGNVGTQKPKPYKRRYQFKDGDWAAAKALSVALLSAHGAGVLLSVATPFQLVGRIEDSLLSTVFVAGYALLCVFGLGLGVAADSVVRANVQDRTRFVRSFYFSFFTLGAALVAVGFILAFGSGWFAGEERFYKERLNESQSPAPLVTKPSTD